MRWLVLAAVLAGCSSARPIMLPNGRQGYYVKCRAVEEKCYARAAQVCPMGYQVVDMREYDRTTLYVSPNVVTGGQGFGHGRMIIECEAFKPKAAQQFDDPFAP